MSDGEDRFKKETPWTEDQMKMSLGASTSEGSREPYFGSVQRIGSHFLLSSGCRRFVAHSIEEICIFIKDELERLFFEIPKA